MNETIHNKEFWKQALKVIAVIALIIIAVKSIDHDRYQPGNGQPLPSITVRGKGEVVTVPNIATMSFSVENTSKAMADAQSAVSTKANALVAVLEKIGIAEKDIKTDGFTAYPKYDYTAPSVSCAPGYCPGTNQVISGYTVSHSYSVKIRDLGKINDVAKALTDANVSSISGPTFEVDNIDQVKNDARDKAIADAKVQAKALASQLGVRLKGIVDFQAVDNGGYMPVAYAAMDSRMMKEAAAPAPDIKPGESTIKTEVSITYRID